MNPRFSSTRVVFWDEHRGEITNTLRFRCEIKNVMLRRDCIVIVGEAEVYVYAITSSSMEPKDHIETCHNEHGVGAISYHNDRFIIATLDKTAGSIRVQNFYTKAVRQEVMHDNPIYLVALDFNGRLGATASEQGTIIRVFDCDTLEVLQELRRGSRPASISSLAFSPSLAYLVGASDHGTLHLWQVRKPEESSFFGGIAMNIMPVCFSYPRSIAKLTLPCLSKLTSRYSTVRGPVCCYTSEEQLIVANVDGFIYKCNFTAGSLVVSETLTYLPEEGRAKDWVSL
jgi:WD40 repeat protein